MGDPPLLSPALKTLSALMGHPGVGKLVRHPEAGKSQLSNGTRTPAASAEAKTANSLNSRLEGSVTTAIP